VWDQIFEFFKIEGGTKTMRKKIKKLKLLILQNRMIKIVQNKKN
jgi:hypothetical protein